MQTSYLSLSRPELEDRVEELREKLKDCSLCPLECGVDRLNGERGRCNSGEELLVSSFAPHHGEERPLVGQYGSGTVFLSNCNLDCVYCQNYELSQLGRGRAMTPGEVAEGMLELQSKGCHNINWVSPTHFLPQLVESLVKAIDGGLEVPIVYNSGGYDSLETLRLLDGMVDVYMPDMKYANDECGLKYSGVPDYWKVNKRIVKEMYRQVGDLKIDDSGVARRGLLIRHLVLPEGIAGTEKVLRFVGEELSRNSYVNVMDQYRPCWKASEYGELGRSVTGEELEKAFDLARKMGLDRGL
ncbi:MAG: radical SAM protein [Candidatus Bipolaricaulota bacterium]|nr:radical SAM protein [Candidatus Bipolaricaulota bacterium]MBS3792927.1 radical SAM protein [Candidatus Bipolaricaulota bacterium]